MTLDRFTQRTTTRSAALGALAAPLAPPAQAEDIIDKLTVRAREKNAAFMRGDMSQWKTLTPMAANVTLMQPFGGPASHGFNASPERMAEMSRYFQNGKTELEVVQGYASGDFAMLVMVERQSGEVGGLPDQDWSLRVTEVYRRSGDHWELLHRHADPLLHRITLTAAARLARGDGVCQ